MQTEDLKFAVPKYDSLAGNGTVEYVDEDGVTQVATFDASGYDTLLYDSDRHTVDWADSRHVEEPDGSIAFSEISSRGKVVRWTNANHAREQLHRAGVPTLA
jgi:hypothetical protein